MGASAIVAGIGVATTAAGTGLQLFGQHKEAKAREAAARRNKEIRDQQAQEILRRTEINARAMRVQREDLLSRQISGAAAGGAALSGSVLQNLNEAAAEFELQELNMRREANFRAQQVMSGAQFELDQQLDATSGLGLQQIATGLGGASNILGQLNRRGVFDPDPKKG